MPLLVGGAALVVYLFTMAPRLTWEHAGRDGGDLITAAWVLGVPHPTGYPTYTLLAWLFTWIPYGSVAWRVHLMSGLLGAGTVALVYVIGRRLSADRPGATSTLGAAVGAWLLAFATLFWGHALIAEVYALHLFFVALVLWLMLRWRDGKSRLAWAALAFGLGMGNHITLTFVAPLVLALLWSGRRRLSWRGVLLAALALAIGLSVYAYLPWRAAADPIVNWGDPDNWEGFRWAVTGQGYRRFFFALPADALVPRLQEWWRIGSGQFPVLAWPLAVLGLLGLARRERWLALGTFVHAAVNLVYSVGYDVTDAFVHLLPVTLYLGLWMGQGAVVLLGAARELGARLHRPRLLRRPWLLSGLVIATLACLPLISLVEKWEGMDLTHDYQASSYAVQALETVEPDALILVSSDHHTFALWYYRYVLQMRPDVAVVNYLMMTFDWYRDTIATHHPELNLPPPSNSRQLRQRMALRNLEQRPVYITGAEDELEGLEVTKVGPLWQVTLP